MFNRLIILIFGFLTLNACGGGSSPSGSAGPSGGASTGPSVVTVSSQSVSFKARQNDNAPDTQTVTASWSGNIVGVVTNFGSSAAPNWLSVEKSGENSPSTLTFTISSTDLSPATYTATMTVVGPNASAAALDQKDITISFEVFPPAASNRADQDKILHFGQEITLNGASIAWSDSAPEWYNREIGTADAMGQPRTNIAAFQMHFNTIKTAGGNSARIWLHTGATVTPVIAGDGTVSGLSRELTNAQVTGQLTAILDAAWAEDILVTFNIFSFNMVCDAFSPVAAKNMLETEFQSYIDNALTPMVTAAKDHPAMFAWEIFNEPEGMSQADFFCPSTEIVTTETVQQVVNQSAAAIHDIDPNVKVATSTHTDLYDNYSNASLTAIPNANPRGTLDFYALHWYDTGWMVSPHVVPASDFMADKPVIVGEYDPDVTGAGGPSAQDSIRTLLENGYDGAWPWSLTTGNVPAITLAMTEAAPLSGALDKAAIEACIRDKPADCYNGPL